MYVNKLYTYILVLYRAYYTIKLRYNFLSGFVGALLLYRFHVHHSFRAIHLNLLLFGRRWHSPLLAVLSIHGDAGIVGIVGGIRLRRRISSGGRILSLRRNQLLFFVLPELGNSSHPCMHVLLVVST